MFHVLKIKSTFFSELPIISSYFTIIKGLNSIHIQAKYKTQDFTLKLRTHTPSYLVLVAKDYKNKHKYFML